MKSSQIYSMSRLEENEVICNGSLFLMAYDGEERSYYAWNYIHQHGGKYEKIVVLSYNTVHLKNNIDVKNTIDKKCSAIVDVPNSQKEFIACLKEIDLQGVESIVVDISSLRTMHIFLMLKYFKLINLSKIRIINTIPYDYIFKEEPFMSYRSYTGDLNLEEIMGFSGMIDMSQDNDLYIFLGFEGTLSLKVVEESIYKSLFLVNTIPAYYQKYKDISVINNYSLLNSKKNKLIYTPADNPFEVYNVLDSKIEKNKSVCIAPLSTKPIALGICLYALENENVRVVYPFSSEYNDIKSHDVYISYTYDIDL